MAAEKQQKELKPGEPLKQSTITVLSVTGGLCILLIFVAFAWAKQPAIALIGVALLAFGILCTLPNLLAWLRGKKIERLIKQGKYNPPKKKDFNPNHRWGD